MLVRGWEGLSREGETDGIGKRPQLQEGLLVGGRRGDLAWQRVGPVGSCSITREKWRIQPWWWDRKWKVTLFFLRHPLFQQK